MHACDGWTDRWTEFSSLYRVCITCSAVKINKSNKLKRNSNEYKKYEKSAEILKVVSIPAVSGWEDLLTTVEEK